MKRSGATSRVSLLLGICCVFLWSEGLAQPPATITIQGTAQVSGGGPLTGTRDYRVGFFDALTSGSQLGSDLTGTTTLSSAGRFSIEITPPAEIFSTAGVWYELAVDSDATPNGIDTGDVFPSRVKVTSVPFAQLSADSQTLSGAAASAYATDAEIVPTILSNDGSGSTLDADLLDGLDGSAYATDTELSTGLAGKANTADLIDSLPRDGAAYVIVKTTDNASTNGLNLLAAYAQAKALTPHGQALSATNRAAVIVPPGRYDLGTGQLAMDTEFVDLVGLSTKREDQYIFSQTNGPNTGVLRQTASDVGIENLLVQSTRPTGVPPFNSTDPAAYFPDSDKPATVIRNCEFRDDGADHSWSMRVGIIYSGAYSDCTGGIYAFGSGGGGTASGVFSNCTGGATSFGGGGTASGTFTNCTGGASSFGTGVASGTFTNCTGGDRAFGGSETASGTFTNCIGGTNAFGGDGGTASGTFINCTGGTNSFGGGSLGITTGAKLFGCRMTGTSWSATFSGRMENCYWGAGFTTAASARIYGSTIVGTLNLNSTAAGVTGTRARIISLPANNVFGATSAAAFNIADLDVN